MRIHGFNRLVAIAAVLFFLGSLALWASSTGLDKEILAKIIAAAGTVLTSVLVVVITQHNTKLREIEESHRVPKIQAYEEVTLLVTEIFKATKIVDEQEQLSHAVTLQDRYSAVSRKLIVWASVNALKRWLEFKEYARVAEQNPSLRTGAELLLHLDDVIRAIRADLGLETKGIERGGFVKTFLNNPKELDAMLGS